MLLLKLCLLLLISGAPASTYFCTSNLIRNASSTPSVSVSLLFTSAITIHNTEAFSWWTFFSPGRRSSHHTSSQRTEIDCSSSSSNSNTYTSCSGSSCSSPISCDATRREEGVNILKWNNRLRSSFVGRLRSHSPNQSNRFYNRFAAGKSDIVALRVKTQESEVNIEMEANTKAEQTDSDATYGLSIDTSANDTTDSQTNTCSKNSTSTNSTTLHTFHHPPSNVTLHGLGISLPQFQSWVMYKLQHDNHQDNQHNYLPGSAEDVVKYILSEKIHVAEPIIRYGLRDLWFSRKLICDRTEVLAIYPSEKEANALRDKESNTGAHNLDSKNNCDMVKKKGKRGGFEDMLAVYCDRLIGIMKDELNDKMIQDNDAGNVSSSSTIEVPFHMQTWLEKNYGKQRTDKLHIQNFQKLPFNHQKSEFLHLLNWFKEKFPYYYDRCGECEASYRDDYQDTDEEMEQEEEHVTSTGLIDEDNATLRGSFLGYCYPDEHELEGKAGRTEMYQCHNCEKYTRFPRYNNVRQIVENGGRGRCGEYSIFLYRILRALGHQSRWVVDWTDHVWAEVFFDGRWVHLDPCEAVIDHPLLYQEWGKKQTYIVAFWMPLKLNSTNKNYFLMENKAMTSDNEDNQSKHSIEERSSQSELPISFPFIQDVTMDYTSDDEEEIMGRRADKGKSQDAIARVSQNLLEKFNVIAV